jgi:hypothetical protein
MASVHLTGEAADSKDMDLSPTSLLMKGGWGPEPGMEFLV